MLLLLLVVVVVKRKITDQSEREEGKKKSRRFDGNEEKKRHLKFHQRQKKSDFCIKRRELEIITERGTKKKTKKTKNCSRIIAVLLFSSRSLFSVFVRLRRVFALFVLL